MWVAFYLGQTVAQYDQRFLVLNNFTMQNKEHVTRLCLLARLHKKGAAALTRSIGYTTSNLVSVLAGRYNMSDGVEKRLGEALGFNSEGFSPSGKVVSWLARHVIDVVQLLEHGFEIEILARYISDRERSGTKTTRSVLYQMALLRVRFGETERFVVLRMTKQGIDNLLSVQKMQDRVLFDEGRIAEAQYRYLDIPAWMDIDAMPWSEADRKQTYTLEQKRRMLLAWLAEHVKSQEADEREAEPSFETKLGNMLTASYDLRIQQDGALVGVTNSGDKRRVSVHTQRAAQSSVELPVGQLSEQLIVCAEHVEGLVEILFEGPTKQALVGLGSVRTKTSGPIQVLASELRARNAAVPFEDRIRAKAIQRA